MIAALLKGLALGVLLSISVGPVVFAIIRQSLNNGHKGGFAFVAGVSASDIGLVLICNIFSQLFKAAMSHEKFIGIAGSIFLILMGLYNIFFKKVPQPGEVKAVQVFRKRDVAASFFQGFFMNLLNPGVLLFWFAASATILDDSETATHPDQYRFVVFFTCLLFVLSADICKVFLAGKIRTKLTPHNIHIIDRISGLILTIFGIVLLYGIFTGHIAGKQLN
ncbi:LysE family translocator [Ilyomonas limi]|jgi:threonine/homoserine/homoserine lactone efflux protein|uniref:LysE family translocator n=1 Tax=Ilyomonas limi TaxID=2575867 RepID=A0A4U3KVI7_9BACT|nr:LysE family translocator [Ilyomonas limi]TKK66595.1 LysE family translocator [Ilyomonas limi]